MIIGPTHAAGHRQTRQDRIVAFSKERGAIGLLIQKRGKPLLHRKEPGKCAGAESVEREVLKSVQIFGVVLGAGDPGQRPRGARRRTHLLAELMKIRLYVGLDRRGRSSIRIVCEFAVVGVELALRHDREFVARPGQRSAAAPGIDPIKGRLVGETLTKIQRVGEAKVVRTGPQLWRRDSGRAKYADLLAGDNVAVVLTAVNIEQNIKTAGRGVAELGAASPDINRALAFDAAFNVLVANRGVLTLPGQRGFLSMAHTGADIENVLTAFTASLRDILDDGFLLRAQ